MAHAGRELERLIAILEELLRPAGLLVLSPDRVKDTVTGRQREVDIAVRDVRDGPVLAICECRDRATTEDVTWVEQIVTKARDLEGSPPAILVSSAGFSDAARKKARSYGHDVRLVTDVAIDEFRSWFQVEHVLVDETERRLLACDIELLSDGADAFAVEVSSALEKEGLEACIFDRQVHGPVAPMHMFEEWYSRNREQVQHGVPRSGRPVQRSVPMTFAEPEKCLSVQTNFGPRPVRAVQLLVEITRTKRLVPASRVTRYSDAGSELAESVEFNLEREQGTVSLHKLDEGPIHVRYRPREA